MRDQSQVLRQLAARSAEIESEERRRMAAELHDVAGQHLAALSIGLQRLKSCMTAPRAPEPPEVLQDLEEAVHQLAVMVRGVMCDLRAGLEEGEGLLEAVRRYSQRLAQRSGLEVAVNGQELTLVPLIRWNLLRILQEALSNTLKHAGATRVQVRVFADSGLGGLEVRDNGVGFRQLRCANGPEHLGLLGMRERALSIHGHLEVQSRPGHGTTVRVRFPIHLPE